MGGQFSKRRQSLLTLIPDYSSEALPFTCSWDSAPRQNFQLKILDLLQLFGITAVMAATIIVRVTIADFDRALSMC